MKKNRQKRRAQARRLRRGSGLVINNAGDVGVINISCSASADQSGENPRFKFDGYSGNSVDLKPYGFDHPVVYNLSTLKNKTKVPILLEHKDPIGHADQINNSGRDLSGEGIASFPGESRDKVLSALKGGFPFEASMGLHVPEKEKNIKFYKTGAQVNGRTFPHPVYVIENSELKELTVTLSGRDSDTSFEFLNNSDRQRLQAAPATGGTPPVAGGGTTATAGQAGQAGQALHTESPTQEVLRAMRLLNNHPKHFDIISNGLENGWDNQRIEDAIQLAELNGRLPKPPSPGSFDSASFETRIVSRMMMSFGCKPETIEAHYGKKIADQVNDAPKVGIIEPLLEIANAQGGRFNGHSDVEDMCEFIRNTGFSTIDYPDFFKKVARAIKDERWAINPPFAPGLCKEVNNRDFRIQERKRVTGGDMWHEVAEDGKIDLYAQSGQRTYQSKLRTHGSLFAMTRQEVINDDMGALSDMMDAMVEGASMTPDYLWGNLFWAQAAAAGTFWVDGENSRGTFPLNDTNLEIAWNYVRQYKEKKEDFDWNVMINDRWSLVYGIALEKTVWELLEQPSIRPAGGSNLSRTGINNYWYKKFDAKMFNQMGNTSVWPGGEFVADDAWGLVPSSTKFAPHDIAYLRGRKTPVIETVQMPANMLAFGTRGYWDVNVNERERTAAFRAKG